MAGVLTVNLVLQKSKVDDISRVQKLNVCAAQLQDIGVLRGAVNMEILSLSLNDISEIGAVSNCHRLRELYLRKNVIRDINQVLHLTRLPRLEILNLSDNPISHDPNYRRFVIAAIPFLKRLDDVKITDSERASALAVFPELTHFAPPPSAYAKPVEGYEPPSLSAAAKGGQHSTHHGLAAKHTPERVDHPSEGNSGHARRGPNPNNAKHQRMRGASLSSTNFTLLSENHHKALTPMRFGVGVAQGAIGPSETGVVQAVKVLCSELSPHSLEEVRRFIDSMNTY